MSDEDISFAKKKKKIVLDDEGDGDQINVITTKTGTENAARENYDHSKANGGKTSDSNKQSPKKPDASQKKSEAKPADKSGQSSKPKPDDSKNAQKSGDKKPVENKDKKEAAKPGLNAEKKSSEANGQQQKKSGDEKKSSPVKPAAKPAPKKRPVESDSESEESDESSDDERRKKKKKQTSPAKKPAKKPEKKEAAKGGPGGVTKVVKSKDTLVYEVLKRWWYAIPDWPPADFDYVGELNKLKLRKVDQKYWRQEPEEKDGLRKVVEMPSFVGVYKDSKGELIDVRPKETCPSYKNFKNKSITELCELHAIALKKQVEELESSEVADERLLGQLKGELKRAERTYEAQKAKAATK